jgi:hypothetical protein
MKDGTVVEGKVERSDASSIYLADDTVVARAEIKEIHHPGAISGAVGTVIGVAGVGFLIAGCIGLATHDDSEDSRPFEGLGNWFLAIFGAVLVIPSTLTAVWGFTTMSSSKSAAAPPYEPERPKVGPVTLTDGERTYWGLGMSWRW